MNNNVLTWREIEIAIKEESSWLKNNINPYLKNNNTLDIQDDLLYRTIASLIVSGKIKATELLFDVDNFFNLIEFKNINNKMHGADWHDSVIYKTSEYFNKLGYYIDNNQPALLYGYADILVKKNNEKPIYIEVDTISAFKLCINLLAMSNVYILNIKFDKIIKFEL